MKNAIKTLMILAVLLQGSAAMGTLNLNVQKVTKGPFSYRLNPCFTTNILSSQKPNATCVPPSTGKPLQIVVITEKGENPPCMIAPEMLTTKGQLPACITQFWMKYNASNNTITLK